MPEAAEPVEQIILFVLEAALELAGQGDLQIHHQGLPSLEEGLVRVGADIVRLVDFVAHAGLGDRRRRRRLRLARGGRLGFLAAAGPDAGEEEIDLAAGPGRLLGGGRLRSRCDGPLDLGLDRRRGC